MLASPARWCQGAWAKDADGQPIGGTVVEAAESEQVASRCLLGELLHQGLAHGYRIEIAVEPERTQVPSNVARAPASWMLAADALAHAALWVISEQQLWSEALTPGGEQPRCAQRREITRGERVLAAVLVNELGSYADAIWSVVLAAETLRAELDRRAGGR